MYCTVENGVVTSGPRLLPAKWYGYQLQSMSAAELAALGWLPCNVRSGRPFAEPPLVFVDRVEYLDLSSTDPVDEAKAGKLAALAAIRYEKETAGVAFAGSVILTDPLSQAKLTGAWVRVQRLPNTRINWKGATGWAEIGKAEVEAAVDAVSAHVQACFNNERAHSEAISALTTVAAIDSYDISTGWEAEA